MHTFRPSRRAASRLVWPAYCLASIAWLAPCLLRAQTPTAEDPAAREQLRADLVAFNQEFLALEEQSPHPRDLLADVAIYAKGLAWAERYEPMFEAADLALCRKALERARGRMAALTANHQEWPTQKGRLVRGYYSAVDGSVQPFGLIIPASYDPGRATRLDVVLHGSTRPVGLSELRFMDRFDPDAHDAPPADRDYIELHPLGRVENCYRWAGETDVFEAIEAVCRNYHIDRDRIVLRGMSMGASGTWHLGLKHPDQFVALGPYCGYVDTHRFSETPLDRFVKVGALPAHQEAGLHMLDSVDYAANAGVVPSIACMGEKDVFFQAHVIMGEAMQREGLQLINLISPGTGHTIDPVTQAEQLRLISMFADRGLDHAPRHLRFVTWTLKYHRCHWLDVLALKQHYVRAELQASVLPDGTLQVQPPMNIVRFAIHPPYLRSSQARLRIGDQEVPLPPLEQRPEVIQVGQTGDAWKLVDATDSEWLRGKRPGLQGPLDDAFAAPFLCVRGTGRASNAAVRAWSNAVLDRFAYEWHRYFRGELPIKDDVQVTQDDVARHHLILFGDPWSNLFIRQVLPDLPITWTEKELTVAGQSYSSADHAPAFIYRNPLPNASERYLVINSGHTFHEAELSLLNYLLFPRQGDWAVFRVGDAQPSSPTEPVREEVVRAGFFDEAWQFRGHAE